MTLLEIFSTIPDFRRAQGLRTDLPQLLSICVLAYLSGHTGYRDIFRFGNAHKKILIDALALRHGIPSHVTFREILQSLDQSSLIAAFHKWSSDLPVVEGEWLSGDGKALRSTVSDSQGINQNFEAVVTLFAQKSGLAKRIGTYHNKSKELGEQEVLRNLLTDLKNMGLVICADALHTQKKL